MTKYGKIIKSTYDGHFRTLEEMLDEIEQLETIARERKDSQLAGLVRQLKKEFIRHAENLKNGAAKIYEYAA